MKKRIIEISVNDEYVLGSGVVIGSEGDDESVALRISFNDTWMGLNIYATFKDSYGENPAVKLLLPSMLVPGDVRTYDVVVPAAATKHRGKMSLVLSGFAVTSDKIFNTETESYENIVYRDAVINTANAYFRVLPSDFSALDVEDQAEATALEQMLTEMNWLNKKIDEYVEDAQEAINCDIERGDGEYSTKQSDSNVDGITNTAISDHSSAWGRGTTAGCRGFEIVATDNANETYTLSAEPKAYAPGDVFSIKGFVTNLHGVYFYTNYGTIASINGSVVKVNDYLPLTLSTEKGAEAWFYVADKPEDGDNDIGTCAHAEGKEVKALGISSHAEGRSTEAIGFYSHAEGRGTKSSFAAHAEGVRTKAMGESSHAEGLETLADGTQSHAEGCWTEAHGTASHAEGSSYDNNGAKLQRSAIANGHASHVEGGGSQTAVEAHYGHAEGLLTTSLNTAAHAEGVGTLAKYAAHAEGSGTKAIGDNSHSEGLNSVASGDRSHAEGCKTTAAGSDTHAEGTSYNESGGKLQRETTANGHGSHAEGGGTQTMDGASYAHAEGLYTIVHASGAHAEGYLTNAYGKYSHVEGYNTKTEASAESAHSEGSGTIAKGAGSHAEGKDTLAEAPYSHAGGIGTKATVNGQTVIGKYNEIDNNALFIVGNGTDTARSNLFSVGVDADGVAYITLGGAKITLDSGEGY